jgi:hypothetical protein
MLMKYLNSGYLLADRSVELVLHNHLHLMFNQILSKVRLLPADSLTWSNNHLHQCSTEYRIINNNDPVSRYNNVYEKRDTEMGFSVTCSSTYKVFLHMYAQILLQILHMHVQYAFSRIKHSQCHG